MSGMLDKDPSFDLSTFLLGQITCVVGSGLCSFEDVRNVFRAIAADDDIWRRAPIALREIQALMPGAVERCEVAQAVADHSVEQPRLGASGKGGIS